MQSSNRQLFVRPERCVGCHACEMACAVAHSHSRTLPGAILESPRPVRRIFVESAGGAKGPIHCRQCVDAPCAGVCPTGALARDPATERVQYYRNKCISCFQCMMACPFGVIRADAEVRSVIRCDLCPDRELPACAEACRTGAIRWQTEADYERERRAETVRDFFRVLQK
jgi:carbon-monoxide dehydrogenase iron sulfur subunit